MINISLRVKNLINRHETRDPKRIAKDLNIHVRYLPYETTKGYFIKIKGNKFIIINSNLDEVTQTIVLAHELGHALLHSDLEFIGETIDKTTYEMLLRIKQTKIY
ncbi:MAG: ImmA/IrrE family metallo-endopeptidase [Zhenhengia sp.]|uniref:ImmA/IrrE family metallo-endopeptidase n=1 Tax=Zhenhengia sp. TaxID=2944208 RepID=UPI003993EE82